MKMNIKLKNILRKFGFKFETTLDEMDNIGLESIDGLQQEPIYNFTFVEETNNFLCQDCKKGILELVIPEILLNNLKLTECGNCGNRIYKDFSFIDLNKKENNNANTN